MFNLNTADFENTIFPDALGVSHRTKHWLVAFLAFTLWDIAITLDDEIHYIWRLPRDCLTKWVFVLTRYQAVFALCRMISLIIPLPLTIQAQKSGICGRIYRAQRTFCGISFACTLALLMTRAYALYFRSRKMAIGMGALLMLQMAFIPLSITLFFPSGLDSAVMCVPKVNAKDLVIFGLLSVIPSLIVLGFTIAKYIIGRKHGWGHIPVVSRVVKDDILVVTFLVAWVMLTILISQFGKDPSRGYSTVTGMISGLPCIVCRIVIRMQRFGGEHPLLSSQQYPQLSTVLPYTYSGAANATLQTRLEYPNAGVNARWASVEHPIDNGIQTVLRNA